MHIYEIERGLVDPEYWPTLADVRRSISSRPHPEDTRVRLLDAVTDKHGIVDMLNGNLSCVFKTLRVWRTNKRGALIEIPKDKWQEYEVVQ